MSQTDVVMGAAGALGSAIVRKLTADEKPVRAVVRDVERARRVLPPSADIVMGDAAGAENVRMVCRDAAVIYHCVNVPYQHRAAVMPGITDNILAAARESGAVWFSQATYPVTAPFGRFPPPRTIHWLPPARRASCATLSSVN